MKGRAKREYIDPVLFALIYLDLGDKDQAFRWLEEVYKLRSSWVTWLKVKPKFDSLRSDPRFEDLLRRTGLSP